MNIRVAHENDASAVSFIAMSLSHFYLKSNKTELPSWFSETLTENAFSNRIKSNDYQNYVYEARGKIVGYLAFRGNSHLYHLFVSNTYQGKGISRKLWDYAINECVSETYTIRSSLFAIPIYKKLGFKIVGEAGDKDGISFQFMELRL